MFGHSLIVAPTGEIAVKSASEDDEVIVFNADVDLAQNLKQTMFNFAAHRRPEHYKLIVERVGAEVTPANDRREFQLQIPAHPGIQYGLPGTRGPGRAQRRTHAGHHPHRLDRLVVCEEHQDVRPRLLARLRRLPTRPEHGRHGQECAGRPAHARAQLQARSLRSRV